MHHFKHIHCAWKRHHTRSLAFATPHESFRVESRGHHHHAGGSANFGVRRPLRYLSHQLDLDESQTRKVAGILNRLKTEQEQAALDTKRTTQALAELMSGEAPLAEELKVALAPRMHSAQRLQDELAHAIQALHAALDAGQCDRFADLLNSGSIVL